MAHRNVALAAAVFSGCLLAAGAAALADPIDDAIEGSRAAGRLQPATAGGRADQIRRPFTLSEPFTEDDDVEAARAAGKDKSPTFNFARGLHLTRSRDGAHAQHGALFSFLHDANAAPDEDDDTYSADFYLRWNPQESFGVDIFERTDLIAYYVAVEGHLSSSEDDAQDAWRFWGGLTPQPFRFLGDDDWLSLELNVKYEADRDFEIGVASGELLLGLVSPELFNAGGSLKGVELDSRHEGLEFRGFRWQPAAVVEGGFVVDDGDDDGDEDDGDDDDITLEDDDDEIFRAGLSATAQARLFSHDTDESVFGAAAPFGLDSIDLVLSDKVQWLATSDERDFANIFQASASFVFTESDQAKTSLGVVYTGGRDSPTFAKVETLSIGLEVKF